jgi:hypothetical protein
MLLKRLKSAYNLAANPLSMSLDIAKEKIFKDVFDISFNWLIVYISLSTILRAAAN